MCLDTFIDLEFLKSAKTSPPLIPIRLASEEILKMSKSGLINLRKLSQDQIESPNNTQKGQKATDIIIEPIGNDTVTIKTEIDDNFGSTNNEFEFVDPNLEIKKEEKNL